MYLHQHGRGRDQGRGGGQGRGNEVASGRLSFAQFHERHFGQFRPVFQALLHPAQPPQLPHYDDIYGQAYQPGYQHQPHSGEWWGIAANEETMTEETTSTGDEEEEQAGSSGMDEEEGPTTEPENAPADDEGEEMEDEGQLVLTDEAVDFFRNSERKREESRGPACTVALIMTRF